MTDAGRMKTNEERLELKPVYREGHCEVKKGKGLTIPCDLCITKDLAGCTKCYQPLFYGL